MVSRLLRLVRDIRRTAQRHDASSPFVLGRIVRLWLGSGIRPRETLRCGLADPEVGEDALAGCFGKRRLERLQRRLNPPGLECLLKDKAAFYLYCLAAGIPIPRLYAVFDVLGGWSLDGGPLTSDGDWEAFLRAGVPAEFALKPAWGIYGEGFQIYTRVGDAFLDSGGRGRSAAEVVRSMREHPWYRRWVIQARLRSHPDLERLSGTSYLQTLRLVTFAAADGSVRAFGPVLKLIGGAAAVDNFQGGRHGNFIAGVRFADGVLRAGRTYNPEGTGMATLAAHPRTGERLEGFRLPFWNEARQVVERAARLFLPVRTIGWDVGLTADGPMIVEGNIWWDPLNILAYPGVEGDEGGMGRLFDTLRAEAKRPIRAGRGYRADRA